MAGPGLEARYASHQLFLQGGDHGGPEHTGSEGRRAQPSRHRPRVRALVPRPCAWFGVLPAWGSPTCSPPARSLPPYAAAKCASYLVRMLKYSFCLLGQRFKPGTLMGAEFIIPVTPLARPRTLTSAEGIMCLHSRPCTYFCLPRNSYAHTGESFRSSAQPPSPFAIAQHPGCPHRIPISAQSDER